MQTTGILNDISIDYVSEKTKVSLTLDTHDIQNIAELKDTKLNVEIKKWFAKRSLDANAYCWVLCDKIAKKISNDGVSFTKEDVYKDAIYQVGTFQPMIVEEKAFEDFKRIWEKQGLGFLLKEVSRKDKCVKVHCYYGSSSYDSKEMSLLLQYLVDYAKEQGVETKPKEDIESLLRSWM